MKIIHFAGQFRRTVFRSSILRIMKLTVAMLIISLTHVSAAINAQITIKEKNIPLQTALKTISQQSGYDFIYSDQVFRDAHSVSLNLSNAPIETALNLCFKDQPLTYKIEDKTVMVRKKDKPNSTIEKQGVNIAIHGRVTDSTGQSIVGVSVIVEHDSRPQNHALTDLNGNFDIDAEIGDKIRFSYVGYIQKIVTVVNQNQLNIVLYPKLNELASITLNTVNTGYQRISKERSAGSFSKPSKEIMQNRSTSMNIIQRLDGLVPGLTINNAPGAEGVLIRGLNSINANRTPLVVVDGIPIDDINSINPQDVDDITILKDATAASIWGSKASNGVIVITTKKGTSSGKLKINYDGFVTFLGKPDLGYLPVLNSQQYIEAAKETFDPVTYPWNTQSAFTRGRLGTVGLPPHETILYNHYRGLISTAQMNNSLDSLASINNRGQLSDLWYRNAVLTNHTISVSGGGKVYKFYGSLSYTNNQSNQIGEKNNVYKINLRQDFNLNKYIKFYLITDLTNNISSSRRNLSIDTRFYPYQLFQDTNGNSLSMPYVGLLSDSTRQSAEARSRISLDYKPLDDRNLALTNTNALLNRVIGGATVNFFKSLRYEGLFSYIKRNNRSTLYDNNASFIQRNELVQFTVASSPSVTPIYYLPTTGGKYSVSNTSQRNWTVRNQLIFDHSWKNTIHQVTMLVGQEAQDQLSNITQSTVRGYSQQLLNSIPIDYAALATGISNPVFANRSSLNKSTLSPDYYTESEIQTRYISYYANGAYTYKRKYSINGSWRIDKSNLFGLDEAAQNRPVWSVGAKWIISDEPFIRNTIINNLALRATYGLTGNSPSPGTASSYNILSSATSASLPKGRSYSVLTPANPNLSWESTKTINLGLDFGVLNNRLYGSFDFYHKKTNDLIGQMPENVLTGYPIIVGNYGDLINNGIELNLNSLNIVGKNFTWSTLLNLSYNKNTITAINYSTPITTGQEMIDQRFFAGYPAFALFAYRYAGLDGQGDPLISLKDQTKTKTRNVAKPEDMKFMGSTQSPWNGGLSNTFTYKGFSLNANIIFNFGAVMRRDVGRYYSGPLIGENALVLNAGNYNSSINLTTGNLNSTFAERWRQPGDEITTNVPSYVSNSAISNSRRDVNYYIYGDLNVLNASYIKMRDITLSYHLPMDLIKRIKTDNITLRLQISNLMLWKANRYGIDPEFQGFSISPSYGGDPETITDVNRMLRVNQGAISIGIQVTL